MKLNIVFIFVWVLVVFFFFQKEEEWFEQRWCSLDEGVAPFPNPLAPYPLPHSSLPLSSSVSTPSPQNRTGCFSVHSAPKSLSQRNDQSDVSECEQDVNGATAGKSGMEHSGPEREGEAGAVPGSGMTSGSEPEISNEAGMSERGSESNGLRLECCPMCLMPFPAE